MLRLENTEIYGWIAAIRGARNPINSWNQSDTSYGTGDRATEIGPRDLALLSKLANAGPDHGKFLRMITVTVDIIAPLYWWKEFDTYKVGTVANSCSTMHKIHSKEFTRDDFSHEYLLEDYGDDEGVCCDEELLERIVDYLNKQREHFLLTKSKLFWWRMIQTLPTSYNQRRTVQLNYSVLRAMYHVRKNHKLDEWRDFCRWIESLPYATELICGGDDHDYLRTIIPGA